MKPIVKSLKQFLNNTSGNIGLTFAAAAIPMIGLTGAAIDYSRLTTERADLAQALDSAVLSVAIDRLEGSAATSRITEIMESLVPEGNGLTWEVASVAAADGTVEASINGTLDSSMMQVIGIDNIDFTLTSAATAESKKLQVVLSLDNTGSMGSSGKIDALIDASHDLLDALEPLVDSDQVEIGLVPFVTAVNVGGSTDEVDNTWIDLDGNATYNGANFDGDADETHHMAVFDAMGATWKGCVEARPAPYDVSDDEPSTGDPDTLWVPYLWPDGPDDRGVNNNYMSDGLSRYSYGKETRLRYVDKYSSQTPYIDEVPWSTYGPNASCPQEVTDLTTDMDLLRDKVDEMTPWYNGGTNVAQGMVWGWRVLSPTPPFTRGSEYSDTDYQKVLIVLTDGRNEIVSDSPHPYDSDYTSYGFIDEGRLGTTSISTGVDKVNEKVEQICESVKDLDILVYTITFQIDDDDLQDLFQDCATVPENYYDVTSNEGLSIAFNAIAEDLGDLRLIK